MKRIINFFNQTPSWFKILLFVIILIRLLLMALPGFKTDILDWESWAFRVIQMGPSKFYSDNFFADYFPFFYFLLWIFSSFFSFIFGNQLIFSSNFEIYFKTINTLFDILTSIMIFKIVKKHNKKISLIAPIVYLANPATIFDISVWGQNDSMPTFFLVTSIYLLNEKKKILNSGLSAVFSVLIKPFIAPLIPAMILRSLLSFKPKQIFISLAGSLILTFAIFILFFPASPINGLYKQFSNSINTYPYGSINAFNFWALFGFWKSDSNLFMGLTYKVWGYIFYLVTLFICLIPIVRLRNIKDYFVYAISFFSFFLFFTRIHERHIFPLITLIVICLFIYKSKLLLASYILISITFFCNLFYSYYYYSFIYLNKHTIMDGLFNLISEHAIFFSAVNLLVFFVIVIRYLLPESLLRKYEKAKFISRKS